MIKFNENNILTGYIKQIIESFNLPTCKIYKENSVYVDKELYLKDDYICQYDEETKEFKQLLPYLFNKLYKNYTTKAKHTGNTYDSYTHEYLGNYLRFIRDYKHVNLMSMYNCFSNRFSSIVDHYNNFVASDSNYKIVMLPVKLFQEYTIAIDCNQPYEIMCGFYNNSLYSMDVTPESSITTLSHIKVKNSQFSTPFVYDYLKNIGETTRTRRQLEDYVKHENDLKMFIKLPFTNHSSIVVLEGKYLNTNDFSFLTDESGSVNFKKVVASKTIIPFAKCENDIETPFVLDTVEHPLTTKLQLLQFNCETSFPFADKLIAYLVNNVICPLDDIGDNIKRMQKTLTYMYTTKEYNSVGIPYIGKYYGK